MPKKKRGRPLSLGELDGKVQQYVRSLRRAGTPVNARIVIGAVEGIIKATDRTTEMVVTFSFIHWPGHTYCSKGWVLYSRRLPPKPRHL